MGHSPTVSLIRLAVFQGKQLPKCIVFSTFQTVKAERVNKPFMPYSLQLTTPLLSSKLEMVVRVKVPLGDLAFVKNDP